MSVENQIRRLVREFPRVRRRRGKRRPGGLRGSASREGLIEEASRHPFRTRLSCSIVICTRDRPAYLAVCLDSLIRLKGEGHEIIVIDNAPSDRATQDLVRDYQKEYRVRYVLEERPGLDIARNRGVREAQGEIVAFTDDDCVVDENWLEWILPHFEDPEVACVTGLVAPWEVETRAQELFEFHYGGMSRGLTPFTMDFTNMRVTNAGRMGAGANMSFRKRVLLDIGLFNEALDCGMPTQSGGDTYAFYKVLASGYRIAYDPSALVWHRHRRAYENLTSNVYGYSVGVASFLTACLIEDRDLTALITAWDWLRNYHVRRLYQKSIGQYDFPIRLMLVEFLGALVGPWAYLRARRVASRGRHVASGSTLTSRELASPFPNVDVEDST